jgi:4-hydroxythreonine-4-phosphate dehydrogenase
MNSHTPPIAITTGEPAGIGPQISMLAALAWQAAHPQHPLILIGDLLHLREVATTLSHPRRVDPLDRALATWDDMSAAEKASTLVVWHCPLFAPVNLGELDVGNAPYVLNTLDIALLGLKNGTFAAMVTAPVHKGIINDAGIAFTGHTEYLAEFAGVDQVVMMLADGREVEQPLRVALATTHVPLSAVSAAITPAGLTRTIDILAHDLIHHFGIAQPRILVTGLNPHAGEGGHMGREEIDIINPMIAAAQARGLDVHGAYPADTLFQPHYLNQADAVLAMYHDQGLPVLKYVSFGHGINITLGLPFIRTSVDHGTALDRAKSGAVDAGSMQAAIRTAARMVQTQSNTKDAS